MKNQDQKWSCVKLLRQSVNEKADAYTNVHAFIMQNYACLHSLYFHEDYDTSIFQKNNSRGSIYIIAFEGKFLLILAK